MFAMCKEHNALQILTSLILILKNLVTFFTDEETKTQRCHITFLRWQSL